MLHSSKPARVKEQCKGESSQRNMNIIQGSSSTEAPPHKLELIADISFCTTHEVTPTRPLLTLPFLPFLLPRRHLLAFTTQMPFPFLPWHSPSPCRSPLSVTFRFVPFCPSLPRPHLATFCFSPPRPVSFPSSPASPLSWLPDMLDTSGLNAKRQTASQIPWPQDQLSRRMENVWWNTRRARIQITNILNMCTPSTHTRS